MLTEALLIEQECTVMLDRLFHGETLTFFGEDGCGQHGRSDFPVHAKVLAYTVDIACFDDDMTLIEAYVRLRLDGYNADQTGHAITDQNLRIALNRLLDREVVDHDALTWGPLDMQGRDVIVLQADVSKLLSW
jgi:hypothetical protein